VSKQSFCEQREIVRCTLHYFLMRKKEKLCGVRWTPFFLSPDDPYCRRARVLACGTEAIRNTCSQRVAACCSVLQCVAVCCDTQHLEPLHTRTHTKAPRTYAYTQQHTFGIHCNTLQQTAAHCNTLQHTCVRLCSA